LLLPLLYIYTRAADLLRGNESLLQQAFYCIKNRGRRGADCTRKEGRTTTKGKTGPVSLGGRKRKQTQTSTRARCVGIRTLSVHRRSLRPVQHIW